MELSESFVLQLLARQARAFLESEISLVPTNALSPPQLIPHLQLNYITVLISLEWSPPIMFAVSLDRSLITQICRVYTADLGIAEDDLEQYLEETAADIVNIFVGNATAGLSELGRPVYLSIPVVITEGKKIGKPKEGGFLSASIDTACGKLALYCIGAKSMLDNEQKQGEQQLGVSL